VPKPTAVVMNMFYTGLGIARSLGEHGVPVIGLSAERGIYGSFTRYAKTRICPDSRRQPEELLTDLIDLGKSLGYRAVLFPTRDHDCMFIDRYRSELAPWFSFVLPEAEVLDVCIDKWKTYQWAERSGVDTPQCWLLDGDADLSAMLNDIKYPCVLKPVAAHQWRTGENWSLVGARKAIPISTPHELLTEYSAVSRADKRALVQELVSGGDDCLAVTACYLDSNSNWVAGFNIKKLLQSPEGFGTGCIVQAAEYPELCETTARLLRNMRFTGIAEVEYKWDVTKGTYRLIEINPRPWDQHRLGKSCGVDLAYLAYCEHAGQPLPALQPRVSADKWVAEDVFLMEALWRSYKRKGNVGSLFHMAKGRRTYAVWSAADPLPLVVWFGLSFVPALANMARLFWSKLVNSFYPKSEVVHSENQATLGDRRG